MIQLICVTADHEVYITALVLKQETLEIVCRLTNLEAEYSEMEEERNTILIKEAIDKVVKEPYRIEYFTT